MRLVNYAGGVVWVDWTVFIALVAVVLCVVEVYILLVLLGGYCNQFTGLWVPSLQWHAPDAKEDSVLLLTSGGPEVPR
jgi:hypothetical protein